MKTNYIYFITPSIISHKICAFYVFKAVSGKLEDSYRFAIDFLKVEIKLCSSETVVTGIYLVENTGHLLLQDFLLMIGRVVWRVCPIVTDRR